MENFLKGLLRFIKELLLIPIYCLSAARYLGITYDELINGTKENDK